MFAIAILFPLFFSTLSSAQNFKDSEAKIAEYKHWLDLVGSDGARLWLRVDQNHRPYRLFVGDGFERANYEEKERFVEIFSQYLAGYPNKFMLIDIFDGASGKAVGEFGWGGFKLY